jgi:D-serine deaminase-like pyridoxal phosphate-dependent protein
MDVSLDKLPTPSLLLDLHRMRGNAERMSRRVSALGARLRPHVKTHKCLEVARVQTAGHFGGVTVSTLAEAEAFSGGGFTDITYAVPIEPHKLDRAAGIARRTERFGVITDDVEVASLLGPAAESAGVVFDVYLKVDCGYHRCGVAPESPEALEIPRRVLDSNGVRFAGILTHAGHSYHARSRAEALDVARAERDTLTELAGRLRAEGVPVPVVSVGSTPTITAVDHLDGVDEARPGNYIFFDEFQAAIGSCSPDDCAVSVLTSVVHRDPARSRVVLDAGAIALSKDRGACEIDPACGYGRVVDVDGRDLGARVTGLSQEHGVVDVADPATLRRLAVGARVRVVANHSCLTVAQHDAFAVVEDGRAVDRWAIHRGW